MFVPMERVPKSDVFLLLGTNLGDRLQNLGGAKAALENEIGMVKEASSVYQTRPWGDSDQPDFFNQVIVIQTDLSPRQVLGKILAIEKHLGRLREKKWGPRLIDVDILFYDRQIVNDVDLVIPHPSLHLRRFTLVPLLEINQELEHPVLKKNIRTLLDECPDALEVIKI